jgi:hypothetical protein
VKDVAPKLVQHPSQYFHVSTLLTAAYTGEPDEIFEFHTDGQSRLFGRDDQQCDIVIWSAINGTDLSRIAGRLWRMEGQLWVRNLSTRHELEIVAPGEQLSGPLPPRRQDGIDPGAARSLPVPAAVVRGPGGCEIAVSQQEVPLALVEPSKDLEGTERVPSVPEDLRPIALALCRPILQGGWLPATYSEIIKEFEGLTVKQARLRVERLCAIYVRAVPSLMAHFERRRQKLEKELAFDGRIEHRAGGLRHLVHPVSADQTRNQPGPPTYFDVAHLLVRRRLIALDSSELTRGRL